MIMTQKEATHRLRMAIIGKTGYENTLVSVDALRIALDALEGYRQSRNIGIPECKKCNDTGSLEQSLDGPFDCHYCGRADENVRVLKWYEGTQFDNGSDADTLNVYYHGVAAGSDLQRARVAELDREVTTNRQKIMQLDRELSAERMVHGVTKRLKEQLDAQLKAAPAPQWLPIESAPNGGCLIDILMPNGTRWCGVHYDRICNEWRLITECGKLLRVKRDYPTHWMPLPATPSPADNGGGNG